jgi:hypothetical protein
MLPGENQMRRRKWMLWMMLLVLVPPGLRADDADQARWNLGTFSWVKRAPSEPGAAPNAQPARLSADELQALLAPVRATVEGKAISLFDKSELKELASALSEAFALARPGEDLLLLSTSRRGRYYQRAEGLTARLFVQGGTLNLIVHDARLAFMDRWLEETTLPTFVYGSRNEASETQLQAPQARRLRPDWLAFPLALQPPLPTAPSTPVAAPVPAMVIAPPLAGSPQTPATPSTATPTLAPAPEGPPKGTPSAGDDAAYEAKAQRLRTLKRLREDNLISEAEYQARREAILKTL